MTLGHFGLIVLAVYLGCWLFVLSLVVAISVGLFQRIQQADGE